MKRIVSALERQDTQKSAYGGFVGDTLAATLASQSDFAVKSVENAVRWAASN